MNTILVVDDEPNYLIVLSELLKEEGFEVMTAQRGEDGLKIVAETDLDLVITDMRLYNKYLPVIMITAFGEVEKAVVAMKAGAYNYLVKPFNNEELLLNTRNCC
jgi:two-component system NtrC family response regulator